MIASYTGRAVVVVQEQEPQLVMVHVQARRPMLAQGPAGLAWWNGQITAGFDGPELIGVKIELRLPSGRTGEAELTVGGNFTGIGDPPV